MSPASVRGAAGNYTWTSSWLLDSMTRQVLVLGHSWWLWIKIKLKSHLVLAAITKEHLQCPRYWAKTFVSSCYACNHLGRKLLCPLGWDKVSFPRRHSSSMKKEDLNSGYSGSTPQFLTTITSSQNLGLLKIPACCIAVSLQCTFKLPSYFTNFLLKNCLFQVQEYRNNIQY